MAPRSYKARAPGSLMLFGEYAVLKGHPAIVASINQYIHVTLTPRSDQIISIDSALGHVEYPVEQLRVEAPLEYVLHTLLEHQPILSGCNIEINAEFSSQCGLGSSAAVTVALLHALYQWKNPSFDLTEIYHTAKKIIVAVQGRASGADIAASVFGGVLEFYATPFSVRTISDTLPIVAVYSGYKTTTTAALKRVAKKESSLAALFEDLGEIARQAIVALDQQDFMTLGKLMNAAQIKMWALGVSTDEIDHLIDVLHHQPTILGAKISGSGLGDCVIGLGHLPTETTIAALPITLSSLGLTHDY